MSDHIPDVNKLVSDTPRTDMMEQHAPVGIRRNSAFEQASDFSRQLERELNVANAIIRQQQLLDEENLRLQERIKRLEEAGDAMATWLSDPRNLGDDPFMSSQWRKAKEAKP